MGGVFHLILTEMVSTAWRFWILNEQITKIVVVNKWIFLFWLMRGVHGVSELWLCGVINVSQQKPDSKDTANKGVLGLLHGVPWSCNPMERSVPAQDDL